MQWDHPSRQVFYVLLAVSHLTGLENCLGLNLADSKNKHLKTETGINCARPSIGREEQKREAWNEKEKSSILKFFNGHGPSCSSSQQLCNRMIDDIVPSSPSGSRNCSGWDHVKTEGFLRKDTRSESARPSLDRDERRGETWNNFKIEEIDPSVIDELPPEIQDEVRGWLQPLKRTKTAKKGSSIAHYFLPAKKT